MTDKDEFNAAANKIVPIENPESSQSITDIQNKRNGLYGTRTRDLEGRIVSITNELDEATFHTLEIMQVAKVNEEAKPDDTKLSSVAKMVASEMLKYGYQPKGGLGPKSNGIVEPIQLKRQRGTNGLGYELSLGRVHQGVSETIFVPEQALILDQVGIDDIVEGIGNLFVAMAGEEEEIILNKLIIRDA
ncbi:hypothetical protein H5410_040975 [Solanum commersonii]|uniref:G-patch domain-containing protein n=1 Tax=Solanum commersonii TaxID=4109 RepID=A0A9J5XRP5_SOLCO|nr:hypothetical protein H5410_040975 [Solanum commersonii]